jgi:S-adenosyl-L-methionine hydrolase (adenosine-forming)
MSARNGIAMADKRQIVTLLTDFGTSDHFVSSVKGAMFSVNPHIEIIDVTHSIPPQDIFAGAFMLRNAYSVFPRFSIHMAVVDPGVGSSRRPIIVMTDNYNFVGPDNGIFSYIYQTEQVNRVIHINAEHYYRIPLSATFHARDIFAPVVGWMTKGVDPTRIGEEITDYVRFNIPTPKEFGPNLIKGHVLHVDNFGNCITNISEEELTYERMEQQKVLVINNHQIHLFCTYYAECPDGEACALFGSNGLLEIAVPKGSAAHLLGANRGTEIAIHFS